MNGSRWMRAAMPAGIGGAIMVAWPTVSHAQYLETYFPPNVPGYNELMGVTVLARPRPLYEQPGVHAGSFVVRPSLDESTGYNSNPTGVSHAPGSWLLETTPSVSANSDWSRNSLGIDLSADNYQYWNVPNDSHTDWTAAIGGGYTIGRHDLTLAYSHLSLHEAPGDIGAVPADTFIHYQTDDIRSAYTFDLGRWSFTPNVDVVNYRFDNTTIQGVPTSQQYRNRWVMTEGVTTHYALSDITNLLVVLEGIQSRFTDIPAGTPTTNSSGVLAMAGLDYAATGVWRYQVLVGVQTRSFQSSAFQSETQPVAQAAVIWTPTQLTTVTARLARIIEDPAAADTAGYTYTIAGLTVDHEYLRNVLLQGRTSVQFAQYLQGGGTQTAFSIGGGVTWLMNRNMRLSANYDFTTQTPGSNSTVSGQPNPTAFNSGSYNRSLFLVALHFGL